MAEATRIFTRLDGTIYLADGGGVLAGTGGYSAAGLLVGPNEYEIDFEDGDLSVTFPRRSVAHYMTRSRVRHPPSLRYAADELGSFSFSAKFRDMRSITDETLMDVLMWAAGGNVTSLVNTGWESTSASALAAADSDVRTVAMKWRFLDEGDSIHTKIFAANFVELGAPTLAEDEFNTISISGTIHDRVENLIFA